MNKLTAIFLTLFVTLSVSSCIKDKYDTPPTGGKDPDIEVTMTIDSLKALFTGGVYTITRDIVIQGVVTGDDKSGNYYKTLVIQDSTAGISIRMDRSALYNDYPIGRRVFIKCKGLYLGEYANLIQLGGSLDEAGEVGGIPSARFDNFVLKGSYFHPVAPKAVTISQLNNSYQNMLIELNNVEFQNTDAGKSYADYYNQSSLNRTIKNCSGGSIIARTSGYAVFANQLTPSGNGKLVAIYTVFNSTSQLIIRDPSDLHLDSVRCGGAPPVGGGNGIMGVKSYYGGSNVTLPSGQTVTGIVITDAATGNSDPKNLVIQDSTGGIVIRFTGAHSFLVGDKVTVNVSGLTLTAFNGLIQVSTTSSPFGVPLANASKVGTGTITPRVVTTAQVNANADAWESTLLTIQNATISGSGTTYNATKSLTDVTGTLNHYTRPQATFSGSTLPSGSKSFTGVLGDFNGPQLSIRNLGDVQ